MRIARKEVYNKETKKIVYVTTWHNEAQAFINRQSNPDNFVVVVRWVSL